ncbi:SgrR family transcriptional regulator [Pontibacillus marinus]|uniref:ABC transporter substrate-binding protein n=1 Tax=Pontibacillus marinus BH030004 = DSM 16465 TaxID=1385511 RepID=A0A0A5FYH9_9BACI|nr:SgrR family transcriptional regulator [Pontibacillus marinus]KGX83860.1 hypothetical protein N783_20800 [Pontibacillus marinus BH030004 = DSM 16465]
MKDIAYFQLRAHLYPKEHNKYATFTLSELEHVWFCTRKNVKRKIKQLEEEGRISYAPGQGRGNPSSLHFHEHFQDEVEHFVHQCVQKDQLDHIVKLFQLPIPKTWIANVSEQVQELFGLQSSQGNKDTLRTGIARKLSTLDPIYSSVTLENHLIDQLSDTLVKYDEDLDEIVPHIAHHWHVDSDHRQWTFYLRKGIRFHHHKILSSEDVYYTFNRLLECNSPMSWMVQDIQSIKCPTPFKVVITLHDSNPFFIRYVSSVNLAILPSDTAFDESKWIGTGPFKLIDIDEQKIVLEAFDYYFLERPLLDRIEFWRVPMGAAKAMSFQIGEGSTNKEQDKYEEIEVGFRFLIFNFRTPPSPLVHDPLLREAIYHVLDINKMWEDLDREEKLKGQIASSFHPWRSNAVAKEPNKIHQLLQNSPYKGEELQLYSLNFPQAIEEAQWFINEAKQYGIHFNLHTFSLDSLYQENVHQHADLSFMGEVASTDIYLSFLGAFYNKALKFRKLLSDEHLNFIDKKLEDFKHQTTTLAQVSIMEDIEAYLRDHHLVIFQYHPLKKRAFDPMIRDIRFQSFGYVDFQKLWIP